MFYEDVQISRGDTLSDLAVSYGYKGREWEKIWKDPKNVALVAMRRVPERIQPGDKLNIPVPWKIISKSLTAKPNGALMEAERDGELGRQLTWVQTVYRHNQPIGPNPNPFCVDACTPDDDLPFYWTNAEITGQPQLRKKFSDHSSRRPPAVALGTTKWRAVLSLAVVNKLNVTIWNSLVWGWDMTPAGAVTTVGPRPATSAEVNGHLQLLRKGTGTGPVTFVKAGWRFRCATP